MASTEYNSEAVKNAGINLGRILDDMSAFSDLKPHWPNAGKFELAQWLERIVDDRRNAIVAHAEHLKIVFEGMESTLKQIAEDFDNLDGDNAKEIKESIGDMRSNIRDEIGELDKNTEKEQKNFSPSTKENGTDGDGYNDNLDAPVGEADPNVEDDDDDDEEEDEDDDDEDDEDEEDDDEEEDD